MPAKDQLLIPETAQNDPNSFELLRVWIANKGQHVSLRSEVWKDPAAWGIMLADLSRHIANSYQQDQGLEPNQTLLRIQKALNTELERPTDVPIGQIRKA